MPDPEQRTIELIEDSPFSPQHKYRLLLTHLGVCRGCTVTIASGPWREGGDPKKTDAEQLMDAHETLGRIKGVYETAKSTVAPVAPPAPKGQPKRVREITAFLVAYDRPTLEELKMAAHDSDFASLGRVYGYPESSTEAAVGHKVMPWYRLPEAVIMTDAVRFVDFPLSEGYWRQELGQVQKWVDLVQQCSPVIYEQLRMQNFCRLSDEQVDSLFGNQGQRRF
jgi:hypothetical protein